MSELVVWLAHQRVGRLLRKPNGNLQFRYDSAYDGPPVSQSLPKQADAHPHAVTRAVFGGLLPEGDARASLARNLGVSETNDFGILAAVGDDVAGAMTLLPDGVDPPTSPTTEPLDDSSLDRVLRNLPQRPLAASTADAIRLSLAGAQPKVPVIVHADGSMALPTNSAAPTTHILKPEPDRFPGLVANEAFCMSLARACGLQAAAVRTGRSESGLPFLIVERYDREGDVDPIRRLHQEDFCQALGRPADAKYQQEGGPSVREAAGLLRDYTAVPARELPRLMRALVFNWLVGNCDAHGKNYSLLYADAGLTLAPLYDVVSTVLYPELTTRMAMTLGAARSIDEVTPSSWERVARDAGYRPAFVSETLATLLARSAEEAARLVETPEHANPSAWAITERIRRLLAA